MRQPKTVDRSRPSRYRVVLRRPNGRYVREYPAFSKYNAKQIQDELEAGHDSGWYAEVTPCS